MSVFDRFINRPVLATVLSMVIALLGFQAIMALTVRQCPNRTACDMPLNP